MALNLSAVFFYVKDFNAKGDGKTKDTSAINKAIEVCSESGGGTVYFPAGTYLTGPVNLKSNIVLYIDAGANILFSDDFDDYPAVWTRWGGCECYAYSPLIFAYGCSNVTITGRGTIDGQGAAWWKVYKERMGSGRLYPVTERDKEFAELNIACTAHGSGGGGWKSQFLRPPLIQIMKCSNVVIEGVTLKNSPFWNTHLLYSDGIVVNGVTILNPHDAPNGDGIDIDSCKNVRISDSFIDAGDDCICLKSGMDEDGRRVGMPTENIAVTNCILNHGHGGIVMGSDVSGGIRNVVVSNCTFIDTDRGIRIKANRARGGVVEDIQVSNVNMKRVFSPLVIHAYYCCGESPDNSFLFDKTTKPVTEKTPVFKNIHLSGVSAREVTASAGFIYGIPELPVENVTLTNVNIEMTQNPDEKGQLPAMMYDLEPMAGAGFFLKNGKNICFHGVSITTRQGSSIHAEDVEGLEIHSFKTHKSHKDTYLIELANVRRAYIGSCSTNPKDEYFVHVEGEETEIISSDNSKR